MSRRCSLPKAPLKVQSKILTTDGCETHASTVNRASCLSQDAALLFADTAGNISAAKPRSGQELECEDQFLVFDADTHCLTRKTAGTAFFACFPPPIEISCESLSALTAIGCTDELVICDGTALRRAPLGESAAIAEDSAFLVCQNGTLELAPVPTASNVLCSDSFLVAQEGTVVRAPIGETALLLCESRFIVCQDGQLVSASLPDGGADCGQDFSLLVCQQVGVDGPNALQSLPVFADEGGLQCDNAFLVCTGEGMAIRSLGTAPQLDCDAQLLICQGDAIQLAPIATAAALGCNVEFLFCDGTSIQRAAIAPTMAILSDVAFVFCNEEGNLESADLGAATETLECTAGFVVSDPVTFELRIQPLGSTTVLSCDAQVVVCQNEELTLAPLLDFDNSINCAQQFALIGCQNNVGNLLVTPSPTGLSCDDGFVVCGQNGFEIRSITTTETPLTCGNGFLVCGAEGIEVRSITTSELPLSCENSFLVCNGEGIELRSITTSSVPLSCADGFLVCGPEGIGVRSITSSNITVPCDAEFLICQGEEVIRASLSSASAVPCSAELVFCDGEQLSRAPLGDGSCVALDNTSGVLVCHQEQVLVKSFNYFTPSFVAGTVNPAVSGVEAANFEFTVNGIPRRAGQFYRVTATFPTAILAEIAWPVDFSDVLVTPSAIAGTVSIDSPLALTYGLSGDTSIVTPEISFNRLEQDIVTPLNNYARTVLTFITSLTEDEECSDTGSFQFAFCARRANLATSPISFFNWAGPNDGFFYNIVIEPMNQLANAIVLDSTCADEPEP